MRPVAEGIWQLDGFPSHAVNAFLVDDVLFDCRTRWDAPSLVRALRRRPPSAIALTHAHPDHWGAAPAVARTFDIPVACHEEEADIVAGGRAPDAGWTIRLGRLLLEGGSVRDVRPVREGDRVGEFRVVHAPGHSHGHVIYFRDADGVAVTGDLVSTMAPWSRRHRLAEPPPHLTADVEENRRSIQRLLELRPSLVLPGHGPVLRDMGRLEAYAEDLVTRRPGSAAA